MWRGTLQLSASIKDLMKKQMEIQASQMMGKLIRLRHFSSCSSFLVILMQDPSAAQYLQCQMRSSVMMADVYKIIGESADMGMDIIEEMSKQG